MSEMKLLFEKSKEGRRCAVLPACDVPQCTIPDTYKRTKPLYLPQMAEIDVVRHYIALSRRAHGVDNGFYPLGSCTMKYNPRLNEDTAALSGFTQVHPLQPQATMQGCMEVYALAEKYLCEITGMDYMTFQPAAGAHGEFTGLLLIKAYHQSRKDDKRTKILVPDSAHGTNPASAVMAGFQVVSVPSREDGTVDLVALKSLADENTAGIMLTNPNTLGIFETGIEEIASTVHGVGGLLYYDGANLNALMGLSRPGDMGFDVIHLNLHKTFSTPHGGGGPGSGAVGCKAFLDPFLPSPVVRKQGEGYRLDYNRPQSIGRVKAFYGNFTVVVKTLTYILSLGSEGIREASENAVLNANYMKDHLSKAYTVPYQGPCMHEFVMSLEDMKQQYGVSAMDVSKRLLEHGIHPPTMYFPLIVHEALMLEPTETESRETLDEAIEVLLGIYEEAKKDPEILHNAPTTTPVRRLDEVGAARKPVLKYQF